jgi:hypothetical protein
VIDPTTEFHRQTANAKAASALIKLGTMIIFTMENIIAKKRH